MSRKRRTVADEAPVVVRSSTAEPGRGAAIEPRAHDWRQLIYVSAGLMTVWTQAGSWVAPPGWAVWAPAGFAHGIRFIDRSRFANLSASPPPAISPPRPPLPPLDRRR